MNRMTARIALLTFAALPICGAMTGCAGTTGSLSGAVAVDGTVSEARTLTLEADKAFREGDFATAETLYRKSLSIFREQPGALNNLGNALVAMNRYIDAEEVYKLAIEYDPARPEIHSNRGRLWLEAGYPRDAINHFEAAIDIDARWMPAIRGKAKASHLLSVADNEYLTMLRQAMILESNSSWRAFFDSERARVQDALQAENAISDSSS